MSRFYKEPEWEEVAIVEIGEIWQKRLSELLEVDKVTLFCNSKQFISRLSIGVEIPVVHSPTPYLFFRLDCPEKNMVFSSFKLAKFPGNCGIIVSTAAMVYGPYRNKGLGTLLNALRIDMATKLNYSIIICTAKEFNFPEQRVLDKNQWEILLEFKNPRTANNTKLRAIVLNQKKNEHGKIIYEGDL